MSTTFQRTFHREKRRVAALSFIAFLAGCLFYLRLDAHVAGLPVSILAGLFYAAIVAPVAFMMFIVMPSQTVLMEAMAVSRLGIAVAVVSLPESSTVLISNPALLACAVAGGGLIVHAMIRSGALKRIVR